MNSDSGFIWGIKFVGSAVLVVVIVAGFIPYMLANAYDDPLLVDRSYDAARSMETQAYRFGPIKDSVNEYSDGSMMPSRTFSIEMYNETSNRWEVIGYSNTHIHKVNVDNTDDFDISIGSTNRINPKTN